MFFASMSAAVDDIRLETKRRTLKEFSRITLDCVEDLELLLAVKVPDEGMRRGIVSQLWQRMESGRAS